MKGICVRKKNGKTYYQAAYQNSKKRFYKVFHKLNDAEEWLERKRQERPNYSIRENERFTDISFSGLKNKSNQNLYIVWDKISDAYRLVTAEQIRRKSGLGHKGFIAKNKSGTYSLKIKKGTKRWTIGTFKTKKEAIEKQNQVLNQIALGNPIKIPTKNSTGYKYVSKLNNKTYRFYLKNKNCEISKYFHTLQEALDYREKYFKENGLEMPKDYIELTFD